MERETIEARKKHVFCFLNKGACIFILYWVSQIMSLDPTRSLLNPHLQGRGWNPVSTASRLVEVILSLHLGHLHPALPSVSPPTPNHSLLYSQNDLSKTKMGCTIPCFPCPHFPGVKS